VILGSGGGLVMAVGCEGRCAAGFVGTDRQTDTLVQLIWN